MKILHRSNWTPPHKFYHGTRIRCHICESHFELEDSDPTPQVDLMASKVEGGCLLYVSCPVCRGGISFVVKSYGKTPQIVLREENEVPCQSEHNYSPIIAKTVWVTPTFDQWYKEFAGCFLSVGCAEFAYNGLLGITNQSSPVPESGTAAPGPESSASEPPR